MKRQSKQKKTKRTYDILIFISTTSDEGKETLYVSSGCTELYKVNLVVIVMSANPEIVALARWVIHLNPKPWKPFEKRS